MKADGELTDGFRILTVGKAPWQVENTDVRVTVRNAKLTKAVLLDINGMATQTPVELKVADGAATVTLPPTTMYLILTGS